MDWSREAATWPLSEHSQFVESPPHVWHVQTLGTGPNLVLLHGAGGATQSFRHLAPLLAESHRVVMMDFPGQGFTRMGTRQRSGLDATSKDISILLDTLDVNPALIVGHSAGAAVALAMTGERPGTPVVGINPALGHFEGAAGWLFPLLAKTLSLTPFVPTLFSRAAQSPGRIEGLLASTGSSLDPAGTDLYRRLVSDPGHVNATLLMMAQWSIDGLLARLPQLETRALFVVGNRDGAVPPKVGREAAKHMREAQVRSVPGQGHLIHETAPDLVAKAITSFAAEDATN